MSANERMRLCICVQISCTRIFSLGRGRQTGGVGKGVRGCNMGVRGKLSTAAPPCISSYINLFICTAYMHVHIMLYGHYNKTGRYDARELQGNVHIRANSSGRPGREPANQVEGAKSDSNREHERHRRKTVLGSVSLSHSRTDAHASQMARGERVQTHASLSTLPGRDRD